METLARHCAELIVAMAPTPTECNKIDDYFAAQARKQKRKTSADGAPDGEDDGEPEMSDPEVRQSRSSADRWCSSDPPTSGGSRLIGWLLRASIPPEYGCCFASPRRATVAPRARRRCRRGTREDCLDSHFAQVEE